MGKFFKGLIKGLWKTLTWTRIAILNLLFLCVVLLVVASIVSAPRIQIPAKTALLLAPTGVLVDQLSYNPSPTDLVLGSDKPAETRLRDLVEAINQASNDSRITSIVMKLNYLQGGGISKLEELGQALENFKTSGKRIYAYSDNFTQQQYYLASYANEIYLNNLGTVLITGFGMYQNYFKDISDKFDVDFHIFRVGSYKDAVEPFMRNGMSKASREHNQQWLGSLWERYTTKVEENRKLASGDVERYITSISTPTESPVSNAQSALDAGLIDNVVSRPELLSALQRLFGEGKDANSFDAFDIQDYIKISRKPKSLAPHNTDTIALIVAEGTIYSGEQPEGTIGSDSLAKTLQRVQSDKSVKAVVLRVNSGGGSAFASEVIRQEILKTKKSGKPVYISMGSLAASGGYWLSAGGNQIWATPTTLTGSIGVWALYPNINRTLKKFGVNTDGFGTSPLSSALRPDVPLTDEAKVAIQRGVDNIYQTFLTIVADARESDPEAVHLIAQGRVWTGQTAKELGLVDNIGTLDDVIKAAAADSNLSTYEVKEFSRPLSPKEEFMRALMDQTAAVFPASAQSKTLRNMTNALLNSRAASTLHAINNATPGEMQVFASCEACLVP